MAKAQARGWVHIDGKFTHAGATETFSQNSGPARGEQTIHIGGTIATVVLIGDHAYIQGSAAAVTNYFGFPASDAATLAGKWISIPSTASDFATVSDGVSLASALKEVGLDGYLSVTAPSKLAGSTVIGIEGTDASTDSTGGPGTLYISVTTGLPVEFDSTSSQGTEHVVFGDWGKPVALAAPAHTVPIASIPGN